MEKGYGWLIRTHSQLRLGLKRKLQVKLKEKLYLTCNKKNQKGL